MAIFDNICHTLVKEVPAMASLNISLPNNLREWIDARIKTGDYSSASDYMRDLIRHDLKKHTMLEDALLEGIHSGEPIEINPSFWKKKTTQLKRRINSRK